MSIVIVISLAPTRGHAPLREFCHFLSAEPLTQLAPVGIVFTSHIHEYMTI